MREGECGAHREKMGRPSAHLAAWEEVDRLKAEVERLQGEVNKLGIENAYLRGALHGNLHAE